MCDSEGERGNVCVRVCESERERGREAVSPLIRLVLGSLCPLSLHLAHVSAREKERICY